jgi:hypothetical protein
VKFVIMSLLLIVLSLDGIFVLSKVVQDNILKFRLVNKEIKEALETNDGLTIDIRVNDAGEENLKADFLQRWHGRLNLHCTIRGWTPESKWFKEFRDALTVGRLRPPSLLNLSVEGSNLLSLVETLMGIAPAAQKLRIAYRGDGTELLSAAAPLSSLSHALTMDISVQGKDIGGSQASACLKQLQASSISVCSISLRSSRCIRIRKSVPQCRPQSLASTRASTLHLRS